MNKSWRFATEIDGQPLESRKINIPGDWYRIVCKWMICFSKFNYGEGFGVMKEDKGER